MRRSRRLASPVLRLRMPLVVTSCPTAADQLSVRCLPDAKQLAARGAQLVEADATDADQLRAAFEGAYGVFGMTAVLAGGGIEGCYERELGQGAQWSARMFRSAALASRSGWQLVSDMLSGLREQSRQCSKYARQVARTPGVCRTSSLSPGRCVSRVSATAS